MGAQIFYAVAIGFACGVGVTSFYVLRLEEVLLVLLVALGLMVVGSRRLMAVAPILLSFFLLAVALGGVRMFLAEQSNVPGYFDTVLQTEQVIIGEVVREPDVRERTINLTVDTEYGRVLVRADRHIPVAYGDTVTATGTLERPQSFETEFGRMFDYPGYLTVRGISYTLSFAEVSVTNSGNGLIYLRFLYELKARFMHTIESLVAEPAAGLGEGLLLGVKQALGDELENAFRATGIIHIVVLSGYNIMLVVAFVMYVLSALVPFRMRMWFGLTAIVSFALLVGLSATVVRASIMAALLLVAQTYGRTYLIVRALLLAALVMLIINPYLLVYDVGFQLSFMATLGLILLAPLIEQHLGFVPSTIGIREFLTATVVTQMFVSPILLYQIGQFSLVAVLVNVLVLPMVPIAMLLTFLTGMVGFVSLTVAAPFAFLAHLSLTYITTVALAFAQLPLASVVVPPFSFWWVVVSYGVIAFGVWKLGEQPRETNPMSEWVIELEEVVEARLKEEAGTSRRDAPAESPIFFR